ncbi:MAG TPA: response regulator transcription factor [bacterium]|nr:response regulator transcription factor [bacterium]HPN67708.1 response regulator transcription factor [bacterium]
MKILIVEDNKELNEFLVNSLKAECYEVDAAQDGQKGLKMAQDNEYDLLMLDLNLPKVNGDQICSLIRSEKVSTPILILTVETDVADKVRLLNSGADDYMTKPFSLEELVARVKAMLRRPKIMKADVIEIDNLIIDVKKHKVTRGDKEINLTFKEFELLEYLAANQGYVITRGKIIEHVWDMNADLFSNSIEVHVFNLRKKIDKKGEKRLIHTVPNRGYKLELKS